MFLSNKINIRVENVTAGDVTPLGEETSERIFLLSILLNYSDVANVTKYANRNIKYKVPGSKLASHGNAMVNINVASGFIYCN